MRLVILTNKGSFFGKRLLNLLRMEKIPVHAIVAIKQPLCYYYRQYKSVKKRAGFIESIYFSFKRICYLIKPKKIPEFFKKGFIWDYEKLTRKTFYTYGTNSASTVKIISSLKPDLIILAQTGIIKKEILMIPAIGIINAHFPILPFYRGIDSYKWALLNKEFDKIGCSIHWVDCSIDTGNIICSAKYQFKGDENLVNLYEKLENLCVKELVSVIKQRKYKNKGILQKKNIGKQYYKMNLITEKRAKKNLKIFLKKNKLDR